MALLWMEGWEGYGAIGNVRYRYQTSGTITSCDIVAGRTGGSALELDFGSGYVYVVPPGGQTVANIVMGWAWYKRTSMVASDMMNFYAYDGSTEQIVIGVLGTGDIFVDRASTRLGETTGLNLLTTTWYYIEVAITFADGTGGSVEVFVNGASVLNLTSIDTRNVTGENCGSIRITGNSSGPHRFDDMYLLDDQGTDQTTRIGPCFIETVYPDADGTTTNWTAQGAGANYVEVDEGNTPDGDTTYNSSSTLSQKDLYGHAALTGNIGTVYAVMPRALLRASSAGQRGIKNVARSNVTEVNGDEWFIDQTYIYIDHIYENDPNGGGSWTESSINAAEFGVIIST